MIPMTDKVLNPEARARAVDHYREKGIALPTFAQMKDPSLIPDNVRARLKNLGLWDLDPMNLFRITWKNEPIERGGLYGDVNAMELPKELTGVDARIVVMIGKWFPTGAHKVGAAYGCLAPKLVSGEFDPSFHKAVWPSTGNYCRGGAFDSYLMDCTSIAILPEEMSRERFTWLEEIGAEVIATPGCESNVKEIYDKCWELKRTRDDVLVFNQFDEFGNAAWHYSTTGSALEELFRSTGGKRLAGYVSATGSAGTIAAGDYLRTLAPQMKVVASEAWQCPTLLMNGFGGHRIEGIGDKHIPWIHNVRNTDAVAAIDDNDCMRLLRLFNETAGHDVLREAGVSDEILSMLPLIGISGIANVLSAIKTAKWFEMTGDDVLLTIATDSSEMYLSRLTEMNEEFGDYDNVQASMDLDRCLFGQATDHYKELTHPDRKAIHNLKYYTWIEQQEKELDDLNAMWDDAGMWANQFAQPARWDEMIDEFNAETGVLKNL
jgi:cysteine synthase